MLFGFKGLFASPLEGEVGAQRREGGWREAPKGNLLGAMSRSRANRNNACNVKELPRATRS